MHNFSDQCLDLARSLLGNNLQHINEDGTVTPAPGEPSRIDEPGHAALAIGEFFRATGEVELGEFDLYDLTARCDTQQAFVEEENDNGSANQIERSSLHMHTHAPVAAHLCYYCHCCYLKHFRRSLPRLRLWLVEIGLTPTSVIPPCRLQVLLIALNQMHLCPMCHH